MNLICLWYATVINLLTVQVHNLARSISCHTFTTRHPVLLVKTEKPVVYVRHVTDGEPVHYTVFEWRCQGFFTFLKRFPLTGIFFPEDLLLPGKDFSENSENALPPTERVLTLVSASSLLIILPPMAYTLAPICICL